MSLENKVSLEQVINRVKDNPATLVALGLLLGAGGSVATYQLINRLKHAKELEGQQSKEFEKLARTEMSTGNRLSVTKAFLETSISNYFSHQESVEGLTGLVSQARMLHGARQLAEIFPESINRQGFLVEENPEIRAAVRLLSISGGDVEKYFHEFNRARLKKEGYEVFQLDQLTSSKQWREIEEIMQKRWGYLPMAMERHGVKSFSNPFAKYGRMSVENPENYFVISKKGKIAGYVNLNLFPKFPNESELNNISFRQIKDQYGNSRLQPKVLMLTSTTVGFDDSAKRTDDVVSAAFYEVINFAKQNGIEKIYAPALSSEAALIQFRSGKSYEQIFAEVDSDGFPKDAWRASLSLFGDLIEVNGTPVINNELMTYSVSRQEIIHLMTKEERKKTRDGQDLGSITSTDGKYVRLRSFRQGIFEKINDPPVGGEFKLSVGAGWIRINLP